MGKILIFNGKNPDVQWEKSWLSMGEIIGKILIFNGKNPDLQWKNPDFQWEKTMILNGKKQ